MPGLCCTGHQIQVTSEYGMGVDVQDLSNQSPLQLGSYNRHLDIVQGLLDHGADLGTDAKFRHKYAAWMYCLHTMRMLILRTSTA
jgi:ankyrin repeat protein